MSDLPETTIVLPDDDQNHDIVVDIGSDNTNLSNDNPETGIEDLKRQLAEVSARAQEEKKLRESAELSRETERVARQEAERRALAAGNQAQQFRGVSEQHELASVVNALTAAQQQQEHLEGRLAALNEEGNFAEAAKTQSQLARIAARVEQLENGKITLEARRAAPQPQQQQAADPKEAFLQQQSDKTRSWLRQHDRFFTDQTFRNAVQGAHNIAVSRSIPTESDAYFQFIEEMAGLRQPVQAEPVPQQVPTAQAQRTVVPAAAPSRTVPTSTPGRGATITLSPEEREMARTLFAKTKPTDPDPEVIYAKNKAAMIAEGWTPSGLK